MGRTKKRKPSRPTAPWEGRGIYGVSPDGEGPSRRIREAGYKAAEDDRRWFDRNPAAEVRVRQALPLEHDEAFTSAELGPDDRIAVVVVQVVRGRRTRLPFRVVRLQEGQRRLTPAQLDAVRTEWEQSDQRAPMRNEHGQLIDTLALFRMAVAGQGPDEMTPQQREEVFFEG
jgi:hypothetical protein